MSPYGTHKRCPRGEPPELTVIVSENMVTELALGVVHDGKRHLKGRGTGVYACDAYYRKDGSPGTGDP